LGPRRLACQLLHALSARSDAQRAYLVPPGFETNLGLEISIQVDRVHHHLSQAQRAAQLADQPSGVKGRAASDAGSLDQDAVGPAQAGEPVQDGRAADTSTDDDG